MVIIPEYSRRFLIKNYVIVAKKYLTEMVSLHRTIFLPNDAISWREDFSEENHRKLAMEKIWGSQGRTYRF